MLTGGLHAPYEYSPTQNPMSMPRPQFTTCLGCGCTCDDIEATTDGGKLVVLRNTCPRGERWFGGPFGDSEFPEEIRVNGQPANLDEALARSCATIRENPARLLILVADDLSLEGQRLAIGLADQLGATIDGLASATVAGGFDAAARRGRVSGTLGELRHRADLVLWWGCDPTTRYPRFIERFIDAPSLHVAQRRQIAIDIGPEAGPPSLPERLSLAPNEEINATGELRAALHGYAPENHSVFVKTLLDAFTEASLVGIVYDAEPSDGSIPGDRAETLLALGQQLFDTRRAAVWGLRAGGNRNGFEAAMTWQTGFPMAVDFKAGYPDFAAGENSVERLATGRYTRALVLGSPATIPESLQTELARIETIAIGPAASNADFNPAVAIDTGAVGIHESGLVLRMDDVPVEAGSPFGHPYSMQEILQQLAQFRAFVNGEKP